MKNDNLDLHTGTEAAQRFKDFARAIVSVPKTEIDETAKKIADAKIKLNMPKKNKRKMSTNQPTQSKK